MSPDLHHLSGAYAVDGLDADERAAFEAHLAGCADCRAEVTELTGAAQSLAALTDTAPPPGLRSSVLSEIQRVRPLPPPADDEDAVPPPAAVAPPAADAPPAAAVPLRRRRAGAWLLAAAAAAVIAVGGLVWSPWSDDPQVSTPLARVAAAADAARVTGTAGSLTAEVAYSRQLDQGAIAVTGLPPAPDGRTYQLWYVGADGTARSAGLIAPDAGGRGSVLLEGSPARAAAVGLTLEPAGGSTSPTSDPLVVLPLT